MAWSTRQLAELAGTTVKAVRHYHSVGLLDEPERTSNGYKQYGVAHLVRLLQIKRLSDLGLPLAQIATMGRADEEPDEAIRVLDAELEQTIERLQRIRAELAIIVRNRAPIDLPTGFGSGPNMSEATRSLIMIYSRIFNEQALDELREVMKIEDPLDAEFDALTPNADDETVNSLAERMVPGIVELQEKYPTMKHPEVYSMKDAPNTVGQAMVELYNPAQLKALIRVGQLLDERAKTEQNDG